MPDVPDALLEANTHVWQHAEAMQAWKSQQEYDRSIELDAIKEARFEACVALIIGLQLL